MNRAIKVALTILLSQFVLLSEAVAQNRGYTANLNNSNRGTVGIVTGNADSTALSATSDLAQVLDNGNILRIIPIVGQGSQQNVADLLYLKGVDVTIVPSDVLDFFNRTRRYPGIKTKLQYITKLYNEEFHVLANMNYKCLNDLGGRRVNFGLKNSGTAMTAEVVFNAHKVKVERFFFDQKTANEMLKRGELDAVVYVAGKPSRGFENISFKNKVHFLDVTFVDALQENYLPASITNADYPDLVAPKEYVETVSVGAVMAVYNWKRNSTRHRKVSKFIDAFFANFKKFQEFPRHPKWKEVNLNSTVPGWTRFSAAETWLKNNKVRRKVVARQVTSGGTRKRSFQGFLSSLGGDANKLSDADRNALFQQFIQWQKKTRN